MKNSIYILLIALLAACETTITPELKTAEGIFVVDAWITQKLERQEIRITRSQPYFENSFPKHISGAFVEIKDLKTGAAYQFQEGESSYHWDPIDSVFGTIGHTYELTVIVEDESFVAQSRLGRVPLVDSVKFNYKPSNIILKEAFYSAEFVATDPVGAGDTYWIKAWKNGNYLSKPSELNMVFDAGFSAGQALDGQVFLMPIRESFINPLDENPENKNEFLPPYQIGDSVLVEIHSIDPLAYDYLWAVYYHINRPGGFAELFSTPLANATTNLKSTNKSTSTNVAGFFNVASVSSGSGILTKETADRLKKSSE